MEPAKSNDVKTENVMKPLVKLTRMPDQPTTGLKIKTEPEQPFDQEAFIEIESVEDELVPVVKRELLPVIKRELLPIVKRELVPVERLPETHNRVAKRIKTEHQQPFDQEAFIEIESVEDELVPVVKRELLPVIKRELLPIVKRELVPVERLPETHNRVAKRIKTEHQQPFDQEAFIKIESVEDQLVPVVKRELLPVIKRELLPIVKRELVPVERLPETHNRVAKRIKTEHQQPFDQEAFIEIESVEDELVPVVKRELLPVIKRELLPIVKRELVPVERLPETHNRVAKRIKTGHQQPFDQEAFIKIESVEDELVPVVKRELLPVIKRELLPIVKRELVPVERLPETYNRVAKRIKTEHQQPFDQEAFIKIESVEDELVPVVKRELLPVIKRELLPIVKRELVPVERLPETHNRVAKRIKTEHQQPFDQEAFIKIESVEDELVPVVKRELLPVIKRELLPIVKRELVPVERLPETHNRVAKSIKTEHQQPFDQEAFIKIESVEDELVPVVKRELLPVIKRELLPIVKRELVPVERLPETHNIVAKRIKTEHQQLFNQEAFIKIESVEDELVPVVKRDLVPVVERELLPIVKRELVPVERLPETHNRVAKRIKTEHQVEDLVKDCRTIRTTHHKRQYQCEACNKSFSKKSNLTTHLAAVHSGLKPYVCDACKRSFSQKGSLTTHLAAVHSGLKPYVCDICKQSFSQKISLTTHIAAVHSGLKPYVCDACKRSFSQKGNLTTHIAAVHSGLKPYVCDICKRSFSQKSQLTRHLVTVHALL